MSVKYELDNKPSHPGILCNLQQRCWCHFLLFPLGYTTDVLRCPSAAVGHRSEEEMEYARYFVHWGLERTRNKQILDRKPTRTGRQTHRTSPLRHPSTMLTPQKVPPVTHKRHFWEWWIRTSISPVFHWKQLQIISSMTSVPQTQRRWKRG